MTPSDANMLANPYDALEFDKVVALLRRYVSSPLGAARLDAVLDRPSLESRVAADAELATVGEAADWLRDAANRGQRNAPAAPRFDGIEDVREAVQRLSMEDIVLDAQEIRAILSALDISQRIRAALLQVRVQRPALYGCGERLPNCKRLLADLSGKIQPSGEVASLASSALSKIRRQIEKQRQLVETSLTRFVRKYADTGVLQDKYVTMRNGRTVVPIKANWKSRVEGIVHGASSSGQTVFVEPLDTIVQNNRLVRLREKEQGEILRILRVMSGRLRLDRESIAQAVEELGALESVFARARFCLDFRCCRPRFNEDLQTRIVLDEARHPVLQDLLDRQGRKPVPMSLRLERGRRTMIVSGPNAGGKTVVLKTVGILAAMAQAGIPTPAERAEFPWFDGILADIGDAQSISESLSTFSAHVSKLKAMLERATPHSLVVLDELGSATDPEDGGALAVAVVERLQELGGFAVVSTHLPELKMYGSHAPGVASASMGFDEATLGLTYRLHMGIPGQSAGLEMAQRFGMPLDVIRRARELKGQGGEQTSQFLADLRRIAREYEDALRNARRQSRDLQQREQELEREAAAQSRSLRKEMDERIEVLSRDLERRFRKSLDAALQKIASKVASKALRTLERGAAHSLEAYRRAVSGDVKSALGDGGGPRLDDAAEPFVAGDRVRLTSMGISGEIVRRLDSTRWEVRSGSMRLRASSEDIALVEELREESPQLPSGVRLETAVEPSELPSEINVIGKKADEALLDVDKFLDRAVLANKTRLRVIHGFGKDVLRRELWQMFARHVHVSKYYQAEQHEGGAGATIVEVHDA